MTTVKTVVIGDIVKIYKGKKPISLFETETENSARFIQIDDLRNNKNIKFTENVGVSVKPEDVIIAWDGANAGTVGYGLNGIIGSTLAKLEISSNQILPQFLGIFLKGKFRYLRDRCTGATIPHISKRVLTEILMPLPSLEEQRRIVREIDAADLLRQKRKKAIALLDDYLKSTFLEMFGTSTIGSHKWEYAEIKDLAKKEKGSMRTGPFGSDLKHSEFVDKGIAVIGIDNAVQNKFAWGERRFITRSKYEKLKRYTLFPDDVIITIMATTGRSAVIPKDIPLSINTKHLASITLDKALANPYFISYSLHSSPFIKEQIKQKNRGAIMDGLNLGIIKELKLKRPPIELQNKFAEIIQENEQLKQTMLAQSDELDNNFNALMQRAFNN